MMHRNDLPLEQIIQFIYIHTTQTGSTMQESWH